MATLTGHSASSFALTPRMESPIIRRCIIGAVLTGVVLVGYMTINWITPTQTTLVFVTGEEKGLYWGLGKAIATEIQQAHPHIKIQIVSTAGSLDNAKRLQNKKADLALVQNDIQATAEIRSITAIHPELLHFLCHKDSGVQTLQDLSGKKVAVGLKDSGTERFTMELFGYFGVDPSTLQLTHLPIDKAAKELIAGEVSAILYVTGLGNSAVMKAIGSGNVRFAQLASPSNPGTSTETWNDANLWSETLSTGFKIHHPHVSPHTIPLLAYRGADSQQGHPHQPVATVGVKAVLVCHKELPNELAETIARTIFEHRAVLSQKHIAFVSLNEKSSIAHLQFPLHIGAEQFFQRKDPGFLEKYVEVMGFVLTVALIIWSGLIWARRWYIQRRKNRIDTYYQAVEDIIRRLQDGTDLNEIDELEGELLKIRQRASAELVNEQLDANESYIIYQNMLNGCQTMLVRMREKIQASSNKGA
jgi:TRAP transporter TAXI family solute receptor